MFDIPAAIKWAMILGLVLTTLGSIWGVVSYIEAGERNRLISDQLARALVEKDKAIADRNRITAHFMALPDARLRLCVVQGPQSGCCKPEPERCEP